MNKTEDLLSKLQSHETTVNKKEKEVAEDTFSIS